jgi:hypothetical protein
MVSGVVIKTNAQDKEFSFSKKMETNIRNKKGLEKSLWIVAQIYC